MARDCAVRPVAPARIAAASIPGSRCGDSTSLVAIEGFLPFSVSHETTSPVPEHCAKHPLAIAGRFLVKRDSRPGLLLGREVPTGFAQRASTSSHPSPLTELPAIARRREDASPVRGDLFVGSRQTEISKLRQERYRVQRI